MKQTSKYFTFRSLNPHHFPPIIDNWVNGERLAVNGDSDYSDFSEFSDYSDYSH